jgi:hypothetical protein
MARITLTEATAWGEKTKLAPALVTLDEALLEQVEVEVISNLSTVATTTTWVDSNTTPSLAKTIIAKLYVAWIIDRQYSEDDELSSYSALLRASALALMNGILSSAIDIPGVVVESDGLPSHYPTDTSLDRFGQPYGPYFTMDATF